MRIVIALGGNALGNTPSEQKLLVQLPAQKIVNLLKKGHTVVIGHGNGPQVGMIYNAFKDAKKTNAKTAHVPFAEAGGMSQGYIGYHLLSAIKSELLKQKLSHDVVYLETLTYVDKNDPAFNNPTKPVGPFYQTLTEAQAANPNSVIREDAGRGFRVVVPSPKPINFLGIETFKTIIENNAVLIVGGGGGIPVIQNEHEIIGLDGVIDKDFTCARLADQIDADLFVILTAIDYVYVNWKQKDQKYLKTVNVAELEHYIQQQQFASGSMLPKVQAAISFVKDNPMRKAIIADLKDLELALENKIGTTITA